MSTSITCYDYVNQPFELVRRAVLQDALSLFQRATSEGSHSRLHVGIGGIDVGTEIEIELGAVTERREPLTRPTTTMALSWRGRRGPGWFPVMNAELSVYPLSATETQLELVGTYKPPLGMLGGAVDAIALNRLAQESVATFVREVAGYLRTHPLVASVG